MRASSNVHVLRPSPFDMRGGGGPPYDGGMEERVSRIEDVLPTLATKSDVADLRAATKSDMSEMRTELKSDITELRTELKSDMAELKNELKSDMSELRTEVAQQKWWIIGSSLTTILTVIATVVATGIGIQQMTVSTFQAAGQHTQATPPPQPIVIQLPAPPSPTK